LLSGIIVSSGLIVAVAFEFLGSPREMVMKAELDQLKETYTYIHHHLADQHLRLKTLEERDNEVYRTIFESAPLPETLRTGLSDPLEWDKPFAFKGVDQ